MKPEFELDSQRRVRRPRFIARIRGNFLAGLIIIAPIALTAYLLWTAVGWIDSWVWPFIPDAYHPKNVNVRGVGLILFLIFTIMVGWIGKGFLGRSIIRWAEGLVMRMPVVRSVYNGVKQLAETVFTQRDQSFEKACLVEYPRKGIWAVAFLSINAKGEVYEKLSNGKEIATVFLPTTPNPTSGFLLFLPREDVQELDMSVEDAAKLVISAGLVYPSGANGEGEELKG